MRNWLIGLTLALVPATASAQDTKTYLVAEVIPSDTAAYVREFADKVPPLVEAAGGRYLVRAMSTEAVEGTAPSARFAIIEFPNKAAAKAFLTSPDYVALTEVRKRIAKTRLFLAEGVKP